MAEIRKSGRTKRGITLTKDTGMTITKQIEMARKCLAIAPDAYARMLAASIRSAMSDKAANAFRAAIREDGAEFMFRNLNTNCPVAA